MTAFTTTCEVRWADLDPNAHARHTAFMDWATHSRLAAFAAQGLEGRTWLDFGVSPVLFREEADYLREVSGGDTVTVSFEFTGGSPDWKHWRIRHQLVRQDGVHCATVVVRGAWLSLQDRRIVVPPEPIARACGALPRAADFEVLTGRRGA
ncbi:MAG: thioesterase family protein [Gammaproteobacteria bacterium]|nr:thioesterase family protein [Gammaproteobacteria bacterium]